MYVVYGAEQKLDGPNDQYIDELLADNNRVKYGPNRYLYAICNYLGRSIPMPIRYAAGGIKLRYITRDREVAERIVKRIVDAGNILGIPILRPSVKPAGDGEYYAYTVIPRYQG